MKRQADGSGTADQRREQMLRAALEVIVERGYPDTRIADVAQRAGTSPELVIELHGTMRFVKCWGCGERAPMERALEQLGVPHTFLVFPGEDHSLSKDPWHAYIKLREELKWLEKYDGKQ